MKTKHVICYSNGIQSASVAVYIIEKYGKENCILLNHAMSPYIEPEDVTDFGYKLSRRLGVSITYCNYGGYDGSQLQSLPNQFQVCESAGTFINPNGRQILCTNRLKTSVFHEWLKKNHPKGSDIIIYYGFSKNEIHRKERRKKILEKMGYKSSYPLIDDNIPVDYFEKTGIKKPDHYNVFKHGNCWGCLKAGRQHWYCVYVLNRNVFVRAKQAEKKIGYSIIKGVWMHELEPMFEEMQTIGVEPTEHISPQRFWSNAKKKLKQ